MLTNLHSFVAIATNHCGEDVYRFDTDVQPKTDEFYLRAVIGSVNYPTACDFPKKEGKVTPPPPFPLPRVLCRSVAYQAPV